MTLSEPVLQILSESTVDGRVLKLPERKLERELYLEVNHAIECMGGEWNRKMKGHLFGDDQVAERVDGAILTGEVVDPKKEFQFFETPPAVVDRMLELASIMNGDRMLEPEAGKGAIARTLVDRYPLNHLTMVELNPDFCDELVPLAKRCQGTLIQGDFLTVQLSAKVDRVVMNPPFTKQQDVQHFLRAMTVVKPGGRIVSVVSEGAFFRETTLARMFRAALAHGGGSEKLPEGSFKSSGTGVNARLVVLNA